MERPTKVLCKRTLTSGEDHWWDESIDPPIRHEHDNRTLVAGTWYDVVENPHTSWDEEKRRFSFSILDNQKKLHAFRMYEEQDKANWHDACVKYGPNDYAKWFYTPEELILLEKGEFKLDKDIFIRVGQHHWVKEKDGKWVIARCHSKHQSKHGKFYWETMGNQLLLKTEEDFAEIGLEVISQEKQIENEKKYQVTEKLLKEVFVLTDAINQNDPDKFYPSVEYVMPFVNKATDEYFDVSFGSFEGFFD